MDNKLNGPGLTGIPSNGFGVLSHGGRLPFKDELMENKQTIKKLQQKYVSSIWFHYWFHTPVLHLDPRCSKALLITAVQLSLMATKHTSCYGNSFFPEVCPTLPFPALIFPRSFQNLSLLTFYITDQTLHKQVSQHQAGSVAICWIWAAFDNVLNSGSQHGR